MRLVDIRVTGRRRFMMTTSSNHDQLIAANLPQQDLDSRHNLLREFIVLVPDCIRYLIRK